MTPAEHLPFERGIKDALWIYLERLRAFVMVVALAFAACAALGVVLASSWQSTALVTIHAPAGLGVTLLAPLALVLVIVICLNWALPTDSSDDRGPAINTTVHARLADDLKVVHNSHLEAADGRKLAAPKADLGAEQAEHARQLAALKADLAAEHARQLAALKADLAAEHARQLAALKADLATEHVEQARQLAALMAD
jgi:hypothetical protein